MCPTSNLFLIAPLLLIDIWEDISRQGFPGDSLVKNPPANAGDMGLIPGSGRSPGVGIGNLLQYYCLENLADCSPWSHKESDTTEHAHARIPKRKVSGGWPLKIWGDGTFLHSPEERKVLESTRTDQHS